MSIIVVTGPPAGGKSTWIRQHAQHSDITIDYDNLAETLTPPGGIPRDPPANVVAVTQAARNAAIDAALPYRHVCDVYIVDSTPGQQKLAWYRSLGAEVIKIAPTYEECMRRAKAERPPRIQDVVHDWYQRRGLAG